MGFAAIVTMGTSSLQAQTGAASLSFGSEFPASWTDQTLKSLAPQPTDGHGGTIWPI